MKKEYPSSEKFPKSKAIVDGFIWLIRYTLIIKILLLGFSVAGFYGMFTWWFALVLILAIIIHESGHIYMLECFKLKHSGMFIIPFMGGVTYSNACTTKWQSASIALAGPTFGLITTAGFFLAAISFNKQELWTCTSWVAFLNLINLLPVFPLDGRTIIQAAITSITSAASAIFMGVFLLIGLIHTFISGNPLLLFLAGLTIYDVLISLTVSDMEDMSTIQTTIILLGYGVITGLLIMFFFIGLTFSNDLTIGLKYK